MRPIPVRWRMRRIKRWLEAYPLYDPPHKVEERLLSEKLVVENFDYFMRVRLERVTYFRGWLRENFGYKVALDEKGMRALSLWGNKYAGLLLTLRADGYPTSSYFTYDPAWIGENAGHNVLFDLGITLGEAILVNCPKLRWQLYPSYLLPQTSRMLKRTSGMSFQRPQIGGYTNPVYTVTPLHQVYMFAFDMLANTTSVEGIKSFLQLPRFQRRLSLEQPVNLYLAATREYPEGDPAGLLREMGTKAYLKQSDDEVNYYDG
jgi:hypothetical protein